MLSRMSISCPAYRVLLVSVSAVLLSQLAYSAPRFDPANEPQAWIAPIALSNNDLRPVPGLRPDGGAQGFRPWFENGAWQGDLIELDINATGEVSSTVDLGPTVPETTADGNWSARIRFNQVAANNPDFWQDGSRKIIIGTGNGRDAVPFRFDALSAAQQQAILSNAQISDGERIVNFIRGDRSHERSPENTSGELRRRLNILGDIIHSPPKYVAAPNQVFNFDGYSSFANAHRNRPARVYVGANDGMLHAFDAATGDEVFAYIPSMVTAKLGNLTRLPYTHTYFVDGQITTGDVFFDGAWHTVLVGGLGAGGRGFFALDITDAEVASEASLSNRLLWELDASDNDIGFSYSRPTIARLNDGRWYAVMGNGYNSVNSKAKLLIVDIEDGDVVELETDNSGNENSPNGLSSPALIDTNSDGTADAAYAGDINGNLWKFDLSSDVAGQWQVAFNGQPLLALGDDQPIIIPPDVVPNNAIDGFFVYVGTGRAFTVADLDNRDVQSLYGVIDNLQPPGELNAIDQTTTESVFPVPLQVVRTSTFYPLNPIGDNPNRAWRVNKPAGERFLTELQTRASRVQALTFNPVISPNENWLTQPAFDTGGAPVNTILDLNGRDGLGIDDHVDGDGDGAITNAQGDIPMGLLLGQGIRSRPTIVVINAEVDSALINGLFVSALNECPQRFQDICLGRFTNTDEINDRLDELRRQIGSLNANINLLQAELDDLRREQQALNQQLAALLAEQDPDQNSIDGIQQQLDTLAQTISSTQRHLNNTRRERNNLRKQREQAIEFRNALEEDSRQREAGGDRDINDIAVSGIRSLGPNFSLGRRSWVELEP